MIDSLFIDGIDAYLQYKVFIHQDGYAGLVSYPAIKSVNYNDWPDEDGLDVDLSEPMLNSKTFPLVFGCTSKDLMVDFYDSLSDGAYHVFDFRSIGLVRILRMVSLQSKNSLRNLEKFSIQFTDDFPLGDYVYQEPVGSSLVRQSGYRIDGRELSEYGIWVLNGTNDEIEKTSAVKENLLTSNSITPGVIYDGERVFFQSKDVTLKCCMRAASFEGFWHNYNALLYDLVKPDERVFYFASNGKEYPCYYKGSSVSRFTYDYSGQVWCEFAITLVFTSFRIGTLEYLLATENDELITTEDSIYYIDINNYGDN